MKCIPMGTGSKSIFCNNKGRVLLVSYGNFPLFYWRNNWIFYQTQDWSLGWLHPHPSKHFNCLNFDSLLDRNFNLFSCTLAIFLSNDFWTFLCSLVRQHSIVKYQSKFGCFNSLSSLFFFCLALQSLWSFHWLNLHNWRFIHLVFGFVNSKRRIKFIWGNIFIWVVLFNLQQ